MIRNAERPRVAALLAVLAAIALAAGGVMIGKASVDGDGPTAAQLQHETFAAAAAKRETASLRTSLETRITALEKSRKAWRTRTQRAEALTKRWRARARRAERRARTRTAASRRSTAAASARPRTQSTRATPPPPPPASEFPF